MRSSLFQVIPLVLFLAACGAQPETAGDVAPDDDLHRMTAEIPADDVHSTAIDEAMGSPLNTEITVAPEIAASWSGVRVQVVEFETDDAQVFDISLGDTVELSDSGLTLTAVAFVPDFVMDEGGITSRSADPNNPAVRVVISENGAVDYEGWLFAEMPGIHPYPHERYRVLLIEGIPAEGE
jgi:hypothetical protein